MVICSSVFCQSLCTQISRGNIRDKDREIWTEKLHRILTGEGFIVSYIPLLQSTLREQIEGGMKDWDLSTV